MSESESEPVSTTFVTAFVQVYRDPDVDVFGGRDSVWRYAHFRTLAETGVSLCVYVDIEEYDRMNAFAAEFTNIHVLLTKPLSETWSHQVYANAVADNANASTADAWTTEAVSITLPEQAHPEKDTAAYMLLILAKTEWVADVARLNPWNTTQFAWIDFSIAYVFRDRIRCQSEIRRISRTHTTHLCLPGCMSYSEPFPPHIAELSVDELLSVCPALLQWPCWRFCGGLFVGDADSVIEFDTLCRTQFPTFLCKYRRLVWEVNFWAWLESAVPTWRPIWYGADHNDSMLTAFPLDVPVDTVEDIM